MTFHERITAALDGTTPGPWAVGTEWMLEGVTYRLVDGPDAAVPVRWSLSGSEQREQGEADARLIAAAPSLLTECARRLDPGDTDVAEVIRLLDEYADCVATIPTSEVRPFIHALEATKRLLAQVFLDPQETP